MILRLTLYLNTLNTRVFSLYLGVHWNVDVFGLLSRINVFTHTVLNEIRDTFMVINHKMTVICHQRSREHFKLKFLLL